MKTALVTGGSGFIGRVVWRALRDTGWDAFPIDVIDGDMDVRDYFRHNDERFDAVVHCAATVAGVDKRNSVAHAQNLAADAALFEWAERTRPGRVVYFSSSCAYPAVLGLQKRRLLEDDIRWPPTPAMWPDGLYGWGKLTGELLAATAQAAGVPVTVVRPFSVYGPGMKTGFAVRGLLEQIQRRADPVVVWGSAEQTRDYIHVTDVARAVVAIIEQDVDGPVNLGTGQPTSLHELAQRMGIAARYRPAVKVDEGMPAGVPWLVADNTLLRSFCPPRVELGAWLDEVLS